MQTDKLLQALKESKAIKDFKIVGDWNVAVKITLNNEDTLVLDFFGKKLMRSFKKQGE